MNFLNAEVPTCSSFSLLPDLGFKTLKVVTNLTSPPSPSTFSLSRLFALADRIAFLTRSRVMMNRLIGTLKARKWLSKNLPGRKIVLSLKRRAPSAIQIAEILLSSPRSNPPPSASLNRCRSPSGTYTMTGSGCANQLRVRNMMLALCLQRGSLAHLWRGFNFELFARHYNILLPRARTLEDESNFWVLQAYDLPVLPRP